MKNIESCVEYQKARLHYTRSGNGKEVLLCFHGYGQDRAFMKEIIQSLHDDFVIYSFDLFFHGQSFWHEKEKPLNKEFWRDLLQEFLKQNQIEKFSLLGFSMGGKFALATLEGFPERILNFILIAPDGVKPSFWYNIAVHPPFLRNIFKSMIMRPGRYLKMAGLLEKVHLVDKKVIRFADNQMATRAQRRRVYYTWVVFRDLKFDMHKISGILNQQNIPLILFLGEYDKIITLPKMKLLLSNVKQSEVHILKTGHSHLLKAVGEYFLNSKPKFRKQ